MTDKVRVRVIEIEGDPDDLRELLAMRPAFDDAVPQLMETVEREAETAPRGSRPGWCDDCNEGNASATHRDHIRRRDRADADEGKPPGS